MRIFLIFVVPTLSACATGPSADMAFSAADEQGLIAYPMDLSKPFFAKVDLETGERDGELLIFEGTDNPMAGLAKGQFGLKPVEPGTYAYFGNELLTNVVCRDQNAVVFTVKPGEVTVTPFSARQEWPFNEPGENPRFGNVPPMEAIGPFLEGFPGVTAPVVEAKAIAVIATDNGGRGSCGFASRFMVKERLSADG